MDSHARQEQIDRWVADFRSAPLYTEIGRTWEGAEAMLAGFLSRACKVRNVEPGDLEESDLKAGLLEGVAGRAIPAAEKAHVPDLCGHFLAWLEGEGRLENGTLLGKYVRALGPAFEEATADTVRPLKNPGSKLGRNEPCPCGSGKKYKKCCMR